MMPGFVRVDCHTFYADVWQRIKRDVEAAESNWADSGRFPQRPPSAQGHKLRPPAFLVHV